MASPPTESASRTVNRPSEAPLGITSSDRDLHSLFKSIENLQQRTTTEDFLKKVTAIMAQPAVLAQAERNSKLCSDTLSQINKYFVNTLERLDFQRNDDARQSVNEIIATYDGGNDKLFDGLHINKQDTVKELLPLHRQARDEAFDGLDFQSQDARERIKNIIATHTQNVGGLAQHAIGSWEVRECTDVNGEAYLDFTSSTVRASAKFPVSILGTEKFDVFIASVQKLIICYGCFIYLGPILAKGLVEALLHWQKYKLRTQPPSSPSNSSATAPPTSETPNPSDAKPPSPPLPPKLHNPQSGKGLLNKATEARQLHTLAETRSSGGSGLENKASILNCLDNTSLSTVRGGLTSHAGKSNITSGVNALVHTLERMDSEHKDPRMKFVPLSQKPTPLVSSIPHARAVIETTSIGAIGAILKPTTIRHAFELVKRKLH